MERFWEIDFTRGIALIIMLAFNFMTDLQYFAGYASLSGFWFYVARITAAMFVFLVGLSLTISYGRAKQENKANFSKYLKRGLFIFGLGLLITLITFFFIRQDYIRFGVLHLIGLSIILAYPFMKWKKEVSFVLGLLFIGLGFFTSLITVNSNALLFLGLYTSPFSSIDYFPLLPWFGVVLLGIYCGKLFYKDGNRLFAIKHNLKPSNPLCFLGRHTLIIYFIHQPIFMAILYLLGVKVF